MGLFDTIEVAPPGRCRVAEISERLPEEDRVGLASALANAQVPASRIATILCGAGHQVSASTMREHRRGDCRCERS